MDTDNNIAGDETIPTESFLVPSYELYSNGNKVPIPSAIR